MKIYRIVKSDTKLKVGDILTNVLVNFNEYTSIKKQELESELEDYRNSHFPQYSPRNNVLYVCPTIDSAEYWANQKYNHTEQEYLLLELETDKVDQLMWLNSDCCMDFSNPIAHKITPDNYWKSATPDIDRTKEEYEGLFVGSARIIRITKMHHRENCENVQC